MQYSLFIVLSSMAVVSGLMCFNGTLESSTLFSAALLSEEKCLPNVDYCISAQQQADGVTIVLRGCDNSSFCEEPGCSSSPLNVCCCDSDWCNAASTTQYQVVILLSLILSLSLTGFLFKY